MNGWYVSEVTISGSASDPLPGSGIDTFVYTLDGGGETVYSDPLTLSDGQHTLQFTARDNSGLSDSLEQTFYIDTTQPSVTVDPALPTWVHGTMSLNGTAVDNGSGLSSVEISVDSGQTWQTPTGTNAWTYIWNTVNGPNGLREVRVRATDQAGLTTEHIVNVGVDNLSPVISLPDSWLQWDTVTLDILDEHSGLSEARVEISDPKGRGPTRVIQLDPGQFPLDFKWDQRFADGTIAEAGTYDVKVFASDHLGNVTEKGAVIHILLDILPPGATSTPPYKPKGPLSTATLVSTPTPTARMSTATPRATQTVIVSVFGTIAPTARNSPTPASVPTLRATPTQSNAVDWLQSVFAPETDKPSTTQILSPQEEESPLQPVSKDNARPVLWGTAATAAIAAAAAYAQEERRRREEEIARQRELEAREEERREKMKEKKTAKMEAKRAQEEAWEQARLDAWNSTHIALKVERFENEESEIWVAAQAEIRQQYAERKQAEAEKERVEKEKKKAEELQAKLATYYATIQQKENEKEVPKTEPSWWDKTKSFISENIVQPVNTYVYEPLVKPAMETIAEATTNTISWLDKNVYQPHIVPAIEKNKQFIASEFAWINQNIVEPYIKPVAQKVSEATANVVTLVKEKVYQPYVKPAIEKTIQKVSKDVEWIKQNVYEPYVQPVVKAINEKVYQPYVKPVVEKVNQATAKATNWVNENIYQPYLEPVISDINQYVYQPLVNKASNWWDQYGEWVHGALDTAGFIPGLGEIADGLNGLVYLAEGRYLEASLSAMAMIPLIGDLGKAGKWTIKAGQEVVEKVAKEVAEEAIEKAVKESGEELIEKAAQEVTEQVSQAVTETTLSDLSDEVVHNVLKDVVEGQVTKLPSDIVKDLTEESASELAAKISQELGGKKVWVSADTSSVYVSAPPAEGLLLAEQLSKIDLTNREEVEKILKRVAELTSRGSGNHVVLGPFGSNGTFIQKALDTDGVFWDVGDELWEALEKTGIDMFEANNQFLRVHIESGIDRFDVIERNVSEVIDDLNMNPPKDWAQIKYTEKEILDLASMPNIPYQLIDNSWVRVDLISDVN